MKRRTDFQIIKLMEKKKNYNILKKMNIKNKKNVSLIKSLFLIKSNHKISRLKAMKMIR